MSQATLNEMILSQSLKALELQAKIEEQQALILSLRDQVLRYRYAHPDTLRQAVQRIDGSKLVDTHNV